MSQLRLLFAAGSVALVCSVTSRPHAAPFVDPLGTQPGKVTSTPPGGAGTCGGCHYEDMDSKGKRFRAFETWGGTMMANSMRDPLFLAALTVAEQDNKGSGTYCIRCHTPSGFVKGNASDGLGKKLDVEDLEGVSCEGCHRSIQPGALDPKGPYIGNARLFWELGNVKHGPRASVDSPAHIGKVSPFTSSSAMCGQCHDVSNPAVNLKDATGKDTGIPFPLDTLYTEWANSAYASGPDTKSCIDCHMLPVGEEQKSTLSPLAKLYPNIRRHVFVGGNRFGIDAVIAANPDLAVERKESFDLAKDGVDEIEKRALRVSLTKVPTNLAVGSPLAVTVRVENLTGHKFPSGYADGRRAWVALELLDETGKVITSLGGYDTASSQITPDPQLRIYEAIHGQRSTTGGKPTEWHITRHDTVEKDTRIPPKGFKPGPTTQPIGIDFGGQNYDDANFSLSVPTRSPGKTTLRARVWLQTVVKEFVDELERANVTDDRGKTIKKIWESTGKGAPRMIAEVTANIVLDPATSPDAGPIDGGSDAGSTDGAGPVDSGGSAGNGGGDGGCSVGGSSSSWPIGLGVFVGVFAAFRRRNRRPRG